MIVKDLTTKMSGSTKIVLYNHRWTIGPVPLSDIIFGENRAKNNDLKYKEVYRIKIKDNTLYLKVSPQGKKSDYLD